MGHWSVVMQFKGGEEMIIVRKTLVAVLAAALLSAGASLAQAQRQTYRGTNRAVRQLILRLENNTDIFRNSINSRVRGGVYANNNVDGLTQDLAASIDRLRENFDRRAVTAADAQEVLDRGAAIDQIVGRDIRGNAVVRNWNTVRVDLNQLASTFNLSWPVVSQTYPTYPNTSVGTNQLTGTYRLDRSRSDDATRAADEATRNLPYRNRTALRDQLAARLEAPDQLAIERRGREVTIASSRAPQITFSADGIERVETVNGRTTRARATLSGDQLIVTSTGDRANEFNVTFNPLDGGRRLSVTRRVYVEGTSRPVVVQSTYDKTSDVAQFDINNSSQYGYPNTTTPSGDFIVQNGESLIAVLNGTLSTETARNGDRFTATVRQPAQYEGAVIEGHVNSVERSGRITGRSQLTLNFDSIRLRDGRTYRFAGILEGVRSATGETVRIDNEGAVREDSQTTRTAQRAAIGTAVGAIIGAIAGGGKGAAIGAILGAGGGAGSVYVQGRDDLDLEPGTELTIRATGPR